MNRPGAAVSEVELDTLTGDWHLLRTDLCMDVGASLNPAIDVGQVRVWTQPSICYLFRAAVNARFNF